MSESSPATRLYCEMLTMRTSQPGSTDAVDANGEYVKFSKGRFCLGAPSEKLRKELEEELKLNSSDLRSHCWYHGPIPWEVSESLVVNHGDFLIRDSLSRHGDFVLTSFWNNSILHFFISNAVVKSSETYTRVQFILEGEAFNSLPALVHYYVGSQAVLTRQSGAQIHNPVNRALPLRYLKDAFPPDVGRSSGILPPITQRGVQNGEERAFPWSPSTLHRRETEYMQQDRLFSSTGESPITPPSNTASASHPRSPCGSHTASVASSPTNTLHRHPNDTPHSHPLPISDQLHPDTEGGGYTELRTALGSVSYVERLCSKDGRGDDPPRVGSGSVFCSPVVESLSAFRPNYYRSPLMPAENKPLEVCILRRVKELLAEVEPKTAAKHITKADCMVARILDVEMEVQQRMGVSSGIELLTLPHGHQLRLDLMERFHTMSIMLAVDVLGCTGTTEERAGLLHKIIQIAAELKSNMGNMFGFAAIMRALEMPQVSRLEQTWMALRQRYTEGAILYEKTLKPFMKRLNDGRESCPLSNTSFPHMVPLLTLLEKSSALGEGLEPWEMVEAGVDVIMCHLAAARTMAQLGGIFRSNAETKLQGFEESPEILELFLTDFQMRLLWGSRGAEQDQTQRYTKFDQVLTALSNKLEPPSLL